MDRPASARPPPGRAEWRTLPRGGSGNEAAAGGDLPRCPPCRSLCRAAPDPRAGPPPREATRRGIGSAARRRCGARARSHFPIRPAPDRRGERARPRSRKRDRPVRCCRRRCLQKNRREAEDRPRRISRSGGKTARAGGRNGWPREFAPPPMRKGGRTGDRVRRSSPMSAACRHPENQAAGFPWWWFRTATK